MKRLRLKYTYTLIVLSLVVSTALQAVWLQQLFLGQQKQLKEEVEHIVSSNAQTNIYHVLTFMSTPNENKRIKKFFLSPQWEQVRTSANNMSTLYGLDWYNSIEIEDDSIVVRMKFKLTDTPVTKRKKAVSTYPGATEAQIRANDSLALVLMKTKVADDLKQIDITSKTYYNIYISYKNTVISTNAPKGLQPAYTSKKYSFNLRHDYDYQLLVPDINSAVVYRMRYYLASSILMILLTCTAFYFILRLLRKQQLYADAKADFTSNMTHEFKTPIATVSVALESIKKYNLITDPETLQSYLDISQHELQRLNLMVEKVLNISQADDGDHPLHLELYEVQAGLQQVISSMKLQLLNSHATIYLIPSKEPCFVYGDPVHLTNIFYNLIDNAIKYTGESLDLQITCDYQGENADQVVLSFKDNGPGIEKIYQATIFERFFRVPGEGDTHDIKGSGLGLHYVQQMVEKHGGTIKLKSEPGKGSNFIITLPAAT